MEQIRKEFYLEDENQKKSKKIFKRMGLIHKYV